MRYLIVLLAGLCLQLPAAPNASATTISYYFESPPLLDSVSIYYGEDLPWHYDPSQDRFYLEEALREHAHYIAGLRASFTIDWGFFGDDRANLSVLTENPRGHCYWCEDPEPDWLIAYDPPGEGLVIDVFSFGTDANGELSWFSMDIWDIPPFFEIYWHRGAEWHSSSFAGWVRGPCPSPCMGDDENGAEVMFGTGRAGTLTTRVWPTAPTPIPLPAAAWLLLSALFGLGAMRRLRAV